MWCCTSGKSAQKKRDEELKQSATIARPIISTNFVRNPPESIDSRTIIYIWGRRSLIHEDAVFEDPGSGGLDSTVVVAGEDGDISLHTGLSSFESFRESQGVANPSASRNGLVSSPTRQQTNMEFPIEQPAPRGVGQQQQEQHQQQLTLPLTITSMAKIQIIEAACGDTHLLLLSGIGHVYAFGVGRSGQLGLGDERLFVKRPELIGKLTEVRQIAAGATHSVALTSEGAVYVWGDAENVGDACGVDRPVPSRVPKTSKFFERVTLIAAGFSQTMAVTDSNKLFVWGETFFSHYYTTPHCHQAFPPNETITQISIGRQFVLALSEAGRIFACGDGTYCELGRLEGTDLKGGSVLTGTLNPTEMILEDGCGNLLPKIVSIATGARHSLLLSEDGRVFSFGDNLCGQCGVPLHSVRFDTPKPVKIQTGETKLLVRRIAAGLRHSAAITTNHQLVLWGHSAHHKLIHTAPTVSLLEERFGVGVGHMGVSVKSGLKDCCPKVSCICLGDEFTVVITGDGCSGNVNPLVLDSGSTRLHEWQDEYDTDLMEKEKEKDEEKDQEKDEGSDGNQKVETEDQNGTINPTDQNFLHPSS